MASDASCRHLAFLTLNLSVLTWTCLQVNGKLYPMAKVQLGKMGALHPANRLAAYLTGRVGSSRKWPSALSSGVSKPPQVQGSAPAPRTAAQACVGGNPPAVPEPPGKAPVSSSSTGRVTASAAQVDGSLPVSRLHLPFTALAPPPALPSKGSKLYMVPVLSSSGKVPPLQSPLPASSSQKMVLYPVKSTLGVQYYRRADGQLYRLLPMSQLKPFRQNQPGQTGESGLVISTLSRGQEVSLSFLLQAPCPPYFQWWFDRPSLGRLRSPPSSPVSPLPQAPPPPA